MSGSGVYVSQAVEAVRRLHGGLLGAGFNAMPIREQLDAQARNILDGHGRGEEGSTVHLTCWLPATIGWKPDRILARPLTLDEARLAIARECGFADWAAVEALGGQMHDPGFEAAVDAVVAGDLPTLTHMLDERPELATMRSRFGHGSTLLHYVAANGVETYRQVTPLNAADVASLLIARGADVNAEAGMYGGRARTLGLMMTSDHPWRAGVQQEIARVLKAAGGT
jgi:hypothetical protein